MAIITAVLVVVVAIAVGSRENVEDDQAHRRATRVSDDMPVAMGDVAIARLRADALEHKLAAEPDDPQLTLELADACVAAERHRRAARLYAELLDDESLEPVACVRLALVRHRQGQRERALQALQTAVERWPKMQEAHYQLAIVAFAHQDLSLAVREWERAAQLDPDTRLGRAAVQFIVLLTPSELDASLTP
jgi:tetratricopeptide (TPR) repeat protein